LTIQQDFHTLGCKIGQVIQLVRENLFCDDFVLLKNDHETALMINIKICEYEGWNFNSGNYLFTTDKK